MRRLIGTGLAVWLAVVALLGQSGIAPQAARACSCAPTTLADYAGKPEVSVFVGTAGQQVIDRIPVAVATWLQGASPSALVWLAAASAPDQQGGMIFDTCGISIAPGETWLLVVHGQAPAPYATSNCAPNVRLEGRLGDAALAEAELVFGPGQPPPPDAREPDAPTTTGPFGEPMAWAWLLGALLAAGTVLLAVLVLAARRRPLS